MKRFTAIALLLMIVLCTVTPCATAEDKEHESTLVNLYDFHTSMGFVIKDGGYFSADETVCGNGAIPVTGGKTVYFGPCKKGTVNLATYDVRGNFIARVKASDCKMKADLANGTAIYSYALPRNASYVWTAAENKYALDYLLTCDQPFGANELKEHNSATPLKGKRALFIGDSITHGMYDSVADHYGWAGRIGTKNNMDWVNNGQSGYSISTCRQNSYGVIINKLLETKDRDFDYVILHGGVNDVWDAVSIGTVTEGYDPKKFNKSTFAGGLEDLFYNAYLHYGDTAAIGYIINFAMPTASVPTLHEMKPYFDTAKKICKKWNVPYFDMFDNPKVISDMRIGKNIYLPDYIHPNARGYDILSPMVESFMEKLERRAMPDGAPNEDPSEYNVTFTDNYGKTILATTATFSKGPAQTPSAKDIIVEGTVTRRFTGWSFAGKIYQDLDNYDFLSDTTFRAVYTKVFDHGFPDLVDGAWYEEAVEWAILSGVMNGEGTLFSPDKATTRAMLVTVLYRIEGSPDVSGVELPFTDVKAGQWYADAIAWAYKNGVVNGTSGTTFSPTANLTREQFATILYRYANEINGTDTAVPSSANLDKFSDNDEVSSWASEALIWTNHNGYIGGVSATLLSPKSGATRAQMATILHRYIAA